MSDSQFVAFAHLPAAELIELLDDGDELESTRSIVPTIISSSLLHQNSHSTDLDKHQNGNNKGNAGTGDLTEDEGMLNINNHMLN